ncbi:TonB-dependent receptor plug domain-containing protein [Citromicrobium bathyomarinum]|uniref:TonB-dependent receptor n=1 Tax=Citromicrobium bathyomarinum TaxID=72174 RepID=UPI003159FF84
MIVVVGSQIKGSKITDTLPVTVVDMDAIDNIAPSSGDELFRAIPQSGDVGFNEQRTTGGINDARGDVASVNLRSLGTGNTLVLLNGRRMVLHPGYQTENLVPVTSVNANAIPVSGVRRLEVLRDGAAAIYGTDAVGGVVNTVLRDNFDGITGEVQYGGSEGTSLREFEANLAIGRTFNQGRTNLSLFVDYMDRQGMPASERRYARDYDTRPLVAGTPFEGDTDFDNRSTNTPFGEFQLYNYTPTVRQNGGDAITSPSDYFHIQPDVWPIWATGFVSITAPRTRSTTRIGCIATTPHSIAGSPAIPSGSMPSCSPITNSRAGCSSSPRAACICPTIPPTAKRMRR